MFTLSIENHKGDIIQLSQNPSYSIISIEGLTPPNANINSAENANFDGATYKSSRLNTRNIVITLAIEGNAEENRINLYKYVKVKRQCTVYFANGTRDVSISGYVESMNCPLFDKKEIAQISIVCMNPYFVNVVNELVEFSIVEALFEFPFSVEESGMAFSELVVNKEMNIINPGDVSTGMIIEFQAIGTVENPTIYNVGINDSMKVNITMNDGDVIQINTNKGQKGVVLISGGVQTNMINDLELSGSSPWLQLESGDNVMLYTADINPQYLECFISYNDLYEGV